MRCQGWGWCVARALATVQSGSLRPLCHAVCQVPHNCNVIQRVGVFSSVAQHRTSKQKREIREQATLAGLSTFDMHERGWLGVSDSEDGQPLCASAAHKQGWAAVDELGDLSMDDTGWQYAAWHEDGAVSFEADLAREIESFERDISKYEQQPSDLISDAIKHGIVCGGMAH